jgi:DhnA family fructose-bisphosphate aldolase class Ia
MIGKKIWMERIMDRNSGKTVIIPMDHGVTVGPVAGLINMKETIRSIALRGANAIVMHKGLVGMALKNRGEMGLILHLSASTQIATDPNSKTLISTVEEAVRSGADAISYCLVIEEISRVCAAMGLTLAVHNSVAVYPSRVNSGMKSRRQNSFLLWPQARRSGLSV